ncbi:MAG: hypothetical protein II393_03805 [Cytophagales bacterium]|nr:hypothetical protein [Cytophagales bacterium]
MGIKITGGNAIVEYQKTGDDAATDVTVASGDIFYTDPVENAGDALSTVYTTLKVYDDAKTNVCADLVDTLVPADGIIVTVATPAV